MTKVVERALNARGYLPKELPPNFSSETFAANPPTADGKPRVASRFTIPHPSHGRRVLHIVHPDGMLHLSYDIASNLQTYRAFAIGSPIGLSTPTFSATGRPLRSSPYRTFVERCTRQRIGKRFALNVDVSAFYDSIYTHALPWVLSGKTASKASKKSGTIIGNSLDQALTRCMDGQTAGIPTGPDASVLVSEMLLTGLDRRLVADGHTTADTGARYADDYELVFADLGMAESALGHIETWLDEHRLRLNPAKTRICQLPTLFEDDWRTSLFRAPIRTSSGSAFANDTRSYLSQALSLHQSFGAKAILPYAARRIIGSLRGSNLTSPKPARAVLLHLLALIDAAPQLLIQIAELVCWLDAVGFAINRDAVAEVVADFISRHAVAAHSFECCWGLHILGRLDRYPNTATYALAGMSDPAVAALHADLLDRGNAIQHIPSLMARADANTALAPPNWIAAYEGRLRGYTSSYVDGDSTLTALRHAGVSFLQDVPPLAGQVCAGPNLIDGQAEPWDPPDEQPVDATLKAFLAAMYA